MAAEAGIADFRALQRREVRNAPTPTLCSWPSICCTTTAAVCGNDHSSTQGPAAGPPRHKAEVVAAALQRSMSGDGKPCLLRLFVRRPLAALLLQGLSSRQAANRGGEADIIDVQSLRYVVTLLPRRQFERIRCLKAAERLQKVGC
jgi:hypothetical protein